MKKFLRALLAIILHVVLFPLDVIWTIICIVIAVYYEIISKRGKSLIKAGIVNRISSEKAIVHWVKTGELN